MITIGGSNVTPYLLYANRSSSVCQIGSTLEILLDKTCPANLSPGQQVYWDESGLVYSGWVTGVVLERPQERIRVSAHDCIPIVDYFFSDDTITGSLMEPEPAEGEPAEDVATWIDYCFDLVGMLSEPLDEFGEVVPAGINFRFMAMPNVLLGLMGLVGEYFIESDGNYKARLVSLDTGAAVDIGHTTEFGWHLGDNWIRNEVFVIWETIDGQVSGISSDYNPDTMLANGGFKNRIVFGAEFVDSEEAAEDLIERALEFYADPLFVKKATLVETAPLQLSNFIEVEGYPGIVTAIEQEWLGHWVQKVTLDSRCHELWGWARKRGSAYVWAWATNDIGDPNDAVFWHIDHGKIQNEEGDFPDKVPLTPYSSAKGRQIIASYVDEEAEYDDVFLLTDRPTTDAEHNRGLFLSENSGGSWIGPMRLPEDYHALWKPNRYRYLAMGQDQATGNVYAIGEGWNAANQRRFIVDHYAYENDLLYTRSELPAIVGVPGVANGYNQFGMAVAAKADWVTAFVAVPSSDWWQAHVIATSGSSSGSGIEFGEWVRATQGNLYTSGYNWLAANDLQGLFAEYIEDDLWLSATVYVDLFSLDWMQYLEHTFGLLQRSSDGGESWESSDVIIGEPSFEQVSMSGYARVASEPEPHLIFQDVRTTYELGGLGFYEYVYQSGGVKQLAEWPVSGGSIDIAGAEDLEEARLFSGRYSSGSYYKGMGLAPHDEPAYEVGEVMPDIDLYGGEYIYWGKRIALQGRQWSGGSPMHRYLQIEIPKQAERVRRERTTSRTAECYWVLTQSGTWSGWRVPVPADGIERLYVIGYGRRFPTDEEDYAYVSRDPTIESLVGENCAVNPLGIWVERPEEDNIMDEVMHVAFFAPTPLMGYVVLAKQEGLYGSWEADVFDLSSLDNAPPRYNLDSYQVRNGTVRVLFTGITAEQPQGGSPSIEEFLILSNNGTGWEIELRIDNTKFISYATTQEDYEWQNMWFKNVFPWWPLRRNSSWFRLTETPRTLFGVWYDKDKEERGVWSYTGESWVRVNQRTWDEWIAPDPTLWRYVFWQPCENSAVATWAAGLLFRFHYHTYTYEFRKETRLARSGVVLAFEEIDDGDDGWIEPYQAGDSIYFYKHPNPEFVSSQTFDLYRVNAVSGGEPELATEHKVYPGSDIWSSGSSIGYWGIVDGQSSVVMGDDVYPYTPSAVPDMPAIHLALNKSPKVLCRPEVVE